MNILLVPASIGCGGGRSDRQVPATAGVARSTFDFVEGTEEHLQFLKRDTYQTLIRAEALLLHSPCAIFFLCGYPVQVSFSGDRSQG